MYVLPSQVMSDLQLADFDMLVLLQFVNSPERRELLLWELGKLKPDAKIVLVNRKIGDYQCTEWPQIKAERFPGFTVVEVPEAVAVDAGGAWEYMKHRIVPWLLEQGLLVQGTGSLSG